MTKTQLLDRCARDGEERVLLARALDKLELARERGIPAHTGFLSPGEQARVEDMLRAWGSCRYVMCGGFEGAERRICAFLPDWQEEEDWLAGAGETLCALECALPRESGLTHRDILGSLMGLGITREKLGDILLGEERCQLVALEETAPILLSQWDSAARCRLRPVRIPLEALSAAPARVKEIRDTVAALRLDAVLACGFSLSRGKAAQLIASGKAAVNHRECDKPDRAVEQGDVITCRGLGKCAVREVLGQSRKGRTMVVLERYL